MLDGYLEGSVELNDGPDPAVEYSLDDLGIPYFDDGVELSAPFRGVVVWALIREIGVEGFRQRIRRHNVWRNQRYAFLFGSLSTKWWCRTQSEIVSRFKEMLLEYQQGPFANYLPFTSKTEQILDRLADWNPKTIASMHGSIYLGDGKSAIHDLAHAIKDAVFNADRG